MNGKLQNERNDLRAELDEIQDVLDEAEFRAEQLQEQKMMLEEKIAQMKDSFEGEYFAVKPFANHKNQVTRTLSRLFKKRRKICNIKWNKLRKNSKRRPSDLAD